MFSKKLFILIARSGFFITLTFVSATSANDGVWGDAFSTSRPQNISPYQASHLPWGLGVYSVVQNCKDARNKFVDHLKDKGRPNKCRKVDTVQDCLTLYDSCSPTEEEEEEGSQCEDRTKEDLDYAKVETDHYKELAKELKGDIKKLEEDMIGVRDELLLAEEEYREKAQGLQAEHEQAKEGLEAQVKEEKGNIDRKTNEAISGIQEALSNNLKLQHGFENLVTDAHTKRRRTLRGLVEKCKAKAHQKLDLYRKKRRAGFKKGIGNISVVQLMKKSRIPFSTKDRSRFQSYYRQCWNSEQFARNEVEKDFKRALRTVEQKKQQAIAEFAKLEKRVSSLNREAYTNKQTVARDYSQSVKKALEKFNRTYQQEAQNFMKKKEALNQKFMGLQQKAVQKKGELSERERNLYQSKSLQAELRKDKKTDEIIENLNTIRGLYGEAVSACRSCTGDNGCNPISNDGNAKFGLSPEVTEQTNGREGNSEGSR